MEDKQIYDLISRFEESRLSVMEIQKDSFRIHLEKSPAQENSTVPDISRTSQPAESEKSFEAEFGNNIEIVKSPIVGVYYQAPSPEDEPYVTVGQKVQKGQILCLLEAMKMMNELKSPVDGIVKNILGKNGELVEFDQVLFEVEPC